MTVHSPEPADSRTGLCRTTVSAWAPTNWQSSPRTSTTCWVPGMWSPRCTARSNRPPWHEPGPGRPQPTGRLVRHMRHHLDRHRPTGGSHGGHQGQHRGCRCADDERFGVGRRHVPGRDATVVARLRAAGATVTGTFRVGALAQQTRLQAFRVLVQHEPDGLAAGDLARLLEVPQNTLSAHLSVLTRADLVTSERHSRSIVYRANLTTFQAITVFLLQDCCGGRQEICAPIFESLVPCCPPPKKEKSRA